MYPGKIVFVLPLMSRPRSLNQINILIIKRYREYVKQIQVGCTEEYFPKEKAGLFSLKGLLVCLFYFEAAAS